MNRLPWGRGDRFFKGNLHSHTNRSDGRMTPDELVAEYRDHGYDFLAVTDHFMERFDWPVTDTRSFRTATFTTLIGAELHAGNIEAGDPWHMVAVGLPLDFAPTGRDEAPATLARRAADAGAFVALAHPAWYDLTLDDALTIDAAHAIEVYNETCAWINGRAESWAIADALALRGRRLSAIATDDAHCVDRPDCRGAWVEVAAPALDPDALLASLKAGTFYATQGPQIRDLRIEGDRLRLSCSPARAVFLSGRGSKHAAAMGDGIEQADLPLARFAGSYTRVTVVDLDGKRAWSNPIWLD